MRYQVVEGSNTNHCCFAATVVDVLPLTQGKPNADNVCECLDIEDARRIANALNQVEGGL